MQSVSSRIWTRIAVSISNDDSHYTTGTSSIVLINVLSAVYSLQYSLYMCICVNLWVCDSTCVNLSMCSSITHMRTCMCVRVCVCVCVWFKEHGYTNRQRKRSEYHIFPLLRHETGVLLLCLMSSSEDWQKVATYVSFTSHRCSNVPICIT